MILVNLPLSDPRRHEWRAAMRDRRPVTVDAYMLGGQEVLRGVPVECRPGGRDGERWEEWVLENE